MSQARQRYKDLLTIGQLRPAEVEALVADALALKREPRRWAGALAGRSVILLFEKPSLRTRVSFEVGVSRLGGHAMYYDHSKQRIGERESVKDYGRNLERWVRVIVARVFAQRVLEELAGNTEAAVINALSNEHHPCQALADVLTLTERFGTVRGVKVAFVGDGNNVCVSLAQAVTKLGGRMVIVTPPGHAPPAAVIESCRREAAECGGSVEVGTDPALAAGADAVYTDEWVSMHQTGSAERLAAFEPYRVDERVMARASGRAVFMHCLPAVRGQEVTAGVIDDAARSVVYDQAENRMHAQMAVLVRVAGDEIAK
ncbi:MAG: ornithine carbamoyltransferase [Phycisphaeraceae bacterium]|nr:ornithine carbamoyltransferase [Phycisphaeraceae bacterium]